MIPTREQFIEAHRHLLGGLVFDAFTCGLHGPEASVRMRQTYRLIDSELSNIYHELTGGPPPLNGKPVPPANGAAASPLQRKGHP